MNKIAVIYKSSYGSTRKYARWIAEELGADLLETDQTKASALDNYDVIVYGGGLYAGGVNGISLITKNFDCIKDKAIYLFTVGAADVTDQGNIDHIRKSLSSVLTAEMQEKITLYHFRGGMDMPNMGFVHRMMMGMMLKAVRKKSESALTNEDRELLAACAKKVDFTDPSAIAALVDAVRAGVK